MSETSTGQFAPGIPISVKVAIRAGWSRMHNEVSNEHSPPPLVGVYVHVADAGTPQIGPHIQALRKRGSLTLDDLAKSSGVSRSMLSQIERGQANPSLGTVWALCNALKIDISELIVGQVTERKPHVEVASASFTPEIKTEDGSCTLRILSPANHAEEYEWYELIFQPGGSLDSKPHPKGTREHLTVLEGALQVCLETENVDVNRGATARYPGDVPHKIRAIGSEGARALLVMTT